MIDCSNCGYEKNGAVCKQVRLVFLCGWVPENPKGVVKNHAGVKPAPSTKPLKYKNKKVIVHDICFDSKFMLILPFKLPTWNQLFAMNKWERQKVTNWIKEFVFTSIQNARDLQTPMVFPLKPLLTDWQKQAYLQMIQPNTLKRYHIRKKAEKMKKQ